MGVGVGEGGTVAVAVAAAVAVAVAVGVGETTELAVAVAVGVFRTQENEQMNSATGPLPQLKAPPRWYSFWPQMPSQEFQKSTVLPW